MPKPFTGNGTENHERAVLERPEQAARIGLVASEWAILERYVLWLFQSAIFQKDKDGDRESQVAAKAWDAMGTIKARLDFIESVATPMFSPELLDEWKKEIAPKIRDRAKERNKIVHGMWHISRERPNALILFNRSEEPWEYNNADFDDISKRMNEMLEKMGDFWRRVELHIASRT